MKVDLIRKYKWYILGLIVAWILMAVGLSFCSWDSNSINNLSINGGVAEFDVSYSIAVDEDNDGIVDVGDIVNFGKYYQSAEATTKESIRWIVVNKENNQLTLLAESVLAFGTFWNRCYYDGTSWVWEDNSFKQYYQNYMVSTVSMWLNSDYSARHDQGTAFSPNANKLAMRGFLNEAFTSYERSIIQDRTISGIQGMAQGSSNTGVSNYGSKTYKVWLPSWSEIYGTTATPWGAALDGSPNTQFEYFRSGNLNSKLIANATGFATVPAKSNYTIASEDGTKHLANAQHQTAGGAVWWWLRSPSPSYYSHALMIYPDGAGGNAYSDNAAGGVRPAICINA